jgi:hypothetical protein
VIADIAAFMIGMGERSFFALSGSSDDIKAAGGDGAMWAEHSFPFLPEYTKPLGPPAGAAQRHGWGVYSRKFARADVFLKVGAAGFQDWNATIAWK